MQEERERRLRLAAAETKAARDEEARSRLGAHTKLRREHCETCRAHGASELYQHEMQADRVDPRKFAHTPDPTRSSALPAAEWVRARAAARAAHRAPARLLGVLDQVRRVGEAKPKED